MTDKPTTLERNIADKEAPARADKSKPWVAEAIRDGRQVPQWIANLPTCERFEEMLTLRERAFPQTKPTKH